MSHDTEPELIWHTKPTLRRPILVMALEGLFDAAEAATSSVRRLATGHDATPIADIDPERFFDFTERRPTAHFDADHQRILTWPTNTILAAARPSEERDLVLLAGVEPHLRWRSFSSLVTEVVQTLGIDTVVTLGAMVGLAPHTRPLGVVASSTSDELVARFGLARPSYQGPTGVVGVVHHQLGRLDVAVVSLRVPVPHYVPGPPNPEAARSLLARLEAITGIGGGPADMAEMVEMADEWRLRVDAAVDADADLREYVAHLEAQADNYADELLASGDDLAAQLEAFLRDHRRPPDDD